MVSVLDSGSLLSRLSGRGLSLGRGAALCSWTRHFTFTVSLSTQWVPANLLLGGNPAMD